MHPLLSLSVLLATAFVVPGPLPDIIPDGVKGVASETRMTVGPWADGVHTARRLEAGDTYLKVAKNMLGDGSRFRELVDLNPEIDPKRLRIDQTIWLPPRDAKAKDAPWLYVLAEGPGAAPVPCTTTQPLPHARFVSYTFFLVPDKKRVGFEKECRTWESLQKFVEAESIPNAKAPGPPRYVPQDAPIERIVVTVTLSRDDAGKLTAKAERVDYDKAGKVLPPAATDKPKDGPPPPNGPEPKKQWLLLLLALGGGGALWWRSRRPAARPAMA